MLGRDNSHPFKQYSMPVSTQELSQGWKLKETNDTSEEAWLPVSKVPTVVHLDLLENGK